jgi:hypothetical protein
MYHVTLGGQGLVLDLAGYRKRAAAPFAGKVASGDRSYGDLAHEQVWAVSDWSGGEGYLQFDAEAPGRWRSGLGADGSSAPGSLRVGPSLQASFASGLDGFTVLQPYGGKLYAGTTDGKVYQLSGGSWTLSRDTGKAGGVRSMAVFRGELFVGNGSDGVVDSYDGTTWTAGRFTVAGVSGVRSMAVFDPSVPTLHLGCGRSPQAELRRWNGSSVSAVLFNPQEPTPETMLVLNRVLYVFGADSASRRGSIYRYDGTTWEYLLGLPEQYPTVGLVWDGLAYLGMGAGGELWSFDGASARLVRGGLAAGNDELRGLAVWGGALWVGVRSGSEVRLKRFNGQAWSEPAGGGAVSSVQGMATLGGELYVAGQQAGAAPVYKLAAGAYRTSGTLESGLFSAGLPGVDKVFRSARVVHTALASGEAVDLQYRLEDSGAWTTLGTSNLVGATSATFSFPAGVVGRLIGLRVVLTATAGTTPAVYDLLVRYALAPELKREWELAARLEGTAELPLVRPDGSSEPKSGAELSAAVWALKAQPGPLSFVDLDGSSYSVWLADLREEPAQRSQRGGYSTRAVCRLVEA